MAIFRPTGVIQLEVTVVMKQISLIALRPTFVTRLYLTVQMKHTVSTIVSIFCEQGRLIAKMYLAQIRLVLGLARNILFVQTLVYVKIQTKTPMFLRTEQIVRATDQIQLHSVNLIVL